MKKLLLAILMSFMFISIGYAQNPTTAKLLRPNGGEKFRAGTSEDIRWDTTGTFRALWKFQYATSADGPWTDIKGMEKVLDSAANRRGIFAGGFRVPALKTTTAYVRMVLLNADGTLNEAVQDKNDSPFEIEQPAATKIDSVLKNPITSRVELSSSKIYGLDGYVYVDDGGILAIQPGTIIVGDTVGENSAICVNRGGKIFAQGTPIRPIIMTSSAPVGQRRGGDWGGLLMCGKAATNHQGGEAALEGGIADANKVRGWFGGKDTPVDNDSSGVVSYVRIEFAGIAANPNQELNSLTMGGIGRNTVLDHIMVSYANDDAFEWFGGTVNAKYLIAVGTLDDDFDGDNGWSGKVQFGLAQRFKDRADASTSETFEMDNDANSTYNSPLTRPVFSNMTAIGPLQDTSWTSGSGSNQYNSRFGAAIQIRRNARTSIFNSVILGWPRGLELLTSASQGAASRDSLVIRNTSFYGIKGQMLRLDGTTPAVPTEWLANANLNNVLDASTPNNSKLNNPFVYNDDNNFNPVPKADAEYLSNASFADAGVIPITDSFFKVVTYRGAFSSVIAERWDLPWAEYDPMNTLYEPSSVENSKTPFVATDISISPNPSTDVSEVIYNLVSDSEVTIRLIDAVGTINSTYVSNIQQNAGYYSFWLTTRDLPNGIYFLQIITNNGITTNKVIVNR